MPICFQLCRKATGEGPLSLTLVDEEICREFRATPHPVRYFAGWFDNLGFALASGKTWQEIRTREERYLMADLVAGRTDWWMNCMQLLSILRFMEANYTPTSWVEVGRR